MGWGFSRDGPIPQGNTKLRLFRIEPMTTETEAPAKGFSTKKLIPLAAIIGGAALAFWQFGDVLNFQTLFRLILVVDCIGHLDPTIYAFR